MTQEPQTTVRLTAEHRQKIREAREYRLLTQKQAGERAWPHLSSGSARNRWAVLETGLPRTVITEELLHPALAVVGLEADIRVTIRKQRNRRQVKS